MALRVVGVDFDSGGGAFGGVGDDGGGIVVFSIGRPK